MKNKRLQYVIGIDGGGTKTTAALADFNGKILKVAQTGPSNPRNVGVEKSILNISEAIKKVKKGKKISYIVIGLPTLEEEFKNRKNKIIKKLNLKEKAEIVSDQLIALKSGTQRKDGVVLIAGTGCVCHGWREKKEAKTSGWGWLADEGSGFWTGQKGFQAVFQELDGRGQKTLIKKTIFKDWKIKNKEDLLEKVYSKDFVRKISLISVIVDRASKKGDKVAKKIMIEAGKELAKSATTVINKLNFEREKFPLVLVGGMFKSKITLETLKNEIKKEASKVEFIQPKVEPVIGAVKLAIEQITVNPVKKRIF